MTLGITGSMAFDYIMSFSGSFTDYIVPDADQLERLSVSFLVDSLRKEPGGVAGNIAYTMALLGRQPLLLAAVGPDARDYIDTLAAGGVDTSAVLFAPEFTASFFVSTDQGNRQIANFFIGAMGRSTEISLHNYRDAGLKMAIISPNSPDAMVQYVRECQALGLPYVYDPSQQIPLISPEDMTAAINGAHMLTANDYELHIIQERTGLSMANIQAAVDALVVTEGEKGSSIYADGQHYQIPVVPLERIADPTGAGDAYRAGLLTARLSGLNWEEAGRMGALTAAYALEEHGTQKHHFTLAQFAKRYAQSFPLTAGVSAFFG